MDPETVYETMMEILKDDRYAVDAMELFKQEISQCSEFRDVDKMELIEAINLHHGYNEDKKKDNIRRIAELLKKSRAIVEYLSARLGIEGGD